MGKNMCAYIIEVQFSDGKHGILNYGWDSYEGAVVFILEASDNPVKISEYIFESLERKYLIHPIMIGHNLEEINPILG